MVPPGVIYSHGVGADDDLKINTLHRFAKHSPRLVLQEYSHCEVPAGCGGVVIRWYDPTGGVPAIVRVLLLGSSADVWLDGKELATSYVQLVPGQHVIAMHLRPVEGHANRIVTIGAVYDADGDTEVIQRGGPRWRIASAQPDETWIAPGFVDHAWDMPAHATPELLDMIPADQRWSIDHAIGRGQPIYEVPGECWIRVTFIAAEISR